MWSHVCVSTAEVTFRQYLLYKIQQLSRRRVCNVYLLITYAATRFFGIKHGCRQDYSLI